MVSPGDQRCTSWGGASGWRSIPFDSQRVFLTAFGAGGLHTKGKHSAANCQSALRVISLVEKELRQHMAGAALSHTEAVKIRGTAFPEEEDAVKETNDPSNKRAVLKI